MGKSRLEMRFCFITAAICPLALLASTLIGCASKPMPAPVTRPATSGVAHDPRKWESAIAAFEAKDAQNTPPPNPILFVGCSTIVGWRTADAFPDLPVLNRGFGGSDTSDVVYYFDRVVARYRPKTIVFYSGDNDIAAGKTPEQVADDVRQLLALIRRDAPNARVIVVAIKPSISRWKLIEKMRQANRQIRPMVEALPDGKFIDIEAQVLGADGKPHAELFKTDGLHFGPKGYEILNDAVRPFLGK